MRDKEYLSLFNYRKNAVRVSINLDTKEVLDVDPEIIENMKARLKGIDRSNIYDISDRMVDEFSLRREKNKLKNIFKSEDQIKEAFSSIKNIKLVQEELVFEKVDRVFLFNYSHLQANDEPIDEMDFYRFFLFNAKLVT